MTMNERPRIGVAALVRGPDKRLVLGKRKGSVGTGHWGFPGGHLEHGESVLQCAERETLEETGLEVRAVKIAAVAETVFPDDAAALHYVTLFVDCDMMDARAQPTTLEPEKCQGWQWKSWDDIRHMMANEGEGDDRLFAPIVNLLKTQPDFGRQRD